MNSRHRSLFVYHLYMGGPDAAAIEWQALRSSRFAPRLEQLGVSFVSNPREADIVVATGVLTYRNIDAVLGELGQVPSPSVLIAAGDAALGTGTWGNSGVPGIAEHSLQYYADVQITIPGNPPTPQALIAGLAAAAEAISRPGERGVAWQDE